MMTDFQKFMNEAEKTLHDSCRAMVKLDYHEQLINRIIEKTAPGYYTKITWDEIINRQKN